MCHVNATLKCVLLFETWFVVIASSSSFSQLLFLGSQPGCYRLLNLFTLEITNLKCGKDKVVNTKYTIHIPYELESQYNILYLIQTLGLIDTDDQTGSCTFQNWCYSHRAETLRQIKNDLPTAVQSAKISCLVYHSPNNCTDPLLFSVRYISIIHLIKTKFDNSFLIDLRVQYKL